MSIDSISIVEMFSEIAVALKENHDAVSPDLDTADRDRDGGHSARMTIIFDAIEMALAGLDPAQTSPGQYFDTAAETLLAIDASEARLYAAAFRRAGSALLLQTEVSREDFGKAFSAMASGFRDSIEDEDENREIVAVWERASETYHAAEEEGLPMAECLQSALFTAQEKTLDDSPTSSFELSSMLIIRAMRDALE